MLICPNRRAAGLREYKELNWEGSFEDYLELVRENPKVTRTAYQRLYDMILSHGKTSTSTTRRSSIRYNFFRDEQHGGKDAVFGLDVPLMKLVNVFKSRGAAATAPRSASSCCTARSARRSRRSRACSRRASRSTRARPRARSTPTTGRCRASSRDVTGGNEMLHCPMHEEPLRLIPREWRDERRSTSSSSAPSGYPIHDRAATSTRRAGYDLPRADDALQGRLGPR